MIKMSDNDEILDFKSIFPVLFPKLVDDVEEKTLSPLSCIRELESKWVIEFDLPLVSKENISVTFDKGNEITVEAKLREAYFYENLGSKSEFRFFKKKVTLPGQIDEKKITSNFKNGRLTIYLPKLFRGNKIKIN
jgi:HSP20 family protein